MKKLMMVLFMTMGVLCFADYKSDFKWDMTDSAKIEKGLVEATQAKDILFMDNYLMLKAFVGKDAKNITYDEYKNICKSIKFNSNSYPSGVALPMIALCMNRLNPFIINIINDNTLSKYELSYVNRRYSDSSVAKNVIDFNVWRKRFVNLETLNDLSKEFNGAKKFFSLYEKSSIKLTSDEIKADTALMKRAWYRNITVSDGWKQLLVQVELLNKSVQ